jgi:hypothetical protein
VLTLVVILHVPLGNYMARVYTGTTSWRVERVIYRIVGLQPDGHQRWTKYLSSLLAFSAVSVLTLYGLLLLQVHLPEPWGHQGMTPALAVNTVISFTTNTSWQRGIQRQHDLVQRGARPGDGDWAIPTDHRRARDRRYFRRSAARGQHRRYAPHSLADIHRADRERHPAHRGIGVSAALALGPAADALR